MKTKLRLLAAVLIAGGTMFAQSRPFVNNGAAGYGSGSNSFRTATTYQQRDDNAHRNNNAFRNDNAYRSDDRGYNNDRRNDRRSDNRFDNRWQTRGRVFVDDCRR
jgi:hypothetical protein